MKIPLKRKLAAARTNAHVFQPDDATVYLRLSGNKRLPYVTAVEVTYTHGPIRIVIPARMKTDLASFPPLLKLLPQFDPLDRKWRVALVHDRVYGTHEVERKLADAIFEAGAVQDGVDWKLAKLAYVALRLFGWMRW